MAKILVVEDDRNTLSGLVEILTDEGYETTGCDKAETALRHLEHEEFDILLTDLRMPEMNGMELYKRSLSTASDMKTVVITAYSSVREAVEAMKNGVYEYLTKPLNLDELFVVINRAVKERQMYLENLELRNRVSSTYKFENMIGNSQTMKRVFTIIAKVARSQSTVLIRGESGVGKELVARAIHYNSPRADKPLIEISCASFPVTLLESELFGFERGAFTGADFRKKGRFELAEGGTIFLDEIGDISESVQTKLLRVLQEREITRLGGTEAIQVDVRVIAATNRNLELALQQGRFREDLYYRLNVIPVFVPPLRERKEDVPLLVEHFIKQFAALNNRQGLKVSNEALNLCMEYNWPGNVRELENAIENAVVLGDGNIILPEHLPLVIYSRYEKDEVPRAEKISGNTMKAKMESAERIILQDTIQKANGNKSEAAKRLGISLRTMRYKIRKYGL